MKNIGRKCSISLLIVELKKQNMDWGGKRLGKALGVDPSYVRRVLRRYGFPPAPPYYPCYGDSERNWSKPKINELYWIFNMTLQQIGDEYNVTRERIRQVMERFEIPRRRVGNPKGRRSERDLSHSKYRKDLPPWRNTNERRRNDHRNSQSTA